MSVEITHTKATYWIDGQEYASCIYQKGTVPLHGYLGFGVNQQDSLKTSWSFKSGKMQRSFKQHGNRRDGDLKIIDNVQVTKLEEGDVNQTELIIEEDVFATIRMTPTGALDAKKDQSFDSAPWKRHSKAEQAVRSKFRTSKSPKKVSFKGIKKNFSASIN